jgi:hypothetical protein
MSDAPIQVMGLQFTADHERYDHTEALKAWTDLDRVLREAGLSKRDFTAKMGQEYAYALRGKPDGGMTRVVYVSDVEYSALECQAENGIAHPFSYTASAVLRDNINSTDDNKYLD